jgi:hypothetical protein
LCYILFRETEKKLIVAAATVTSGSGTGIAMKIHAASQTPEASVKICKTSALWTALNR